MPTLPLSSQGSGGGRDEGSRAGSRLSEKEDELLRVVERFRICRGGGGGEVDEVEVVVVVVLAAAAVVVVVKVVSPGQSPSPLSRDSAPRCKSVDWLALLTMTFFSVARPFAETRMCVVAAEDVGRSGVVSESVSCLDVMLLVRLTLEDREPGSGNVSLGVIFGDTSEQKLQLLIAFSVFQFEARQHKQDKIEQQSIEGQLQGKTNA